MALISNHLYSFETSTYVINNGRQYIQTYLIEQHQQPNIYENSMEN